ncbi:glycoside hydrolase family 28 protein [Congregicoccus parvus]|uniref:glycoside hydrolase family 28 protein n=1 Tax=Congregicoccus parvus TaxID=3081749 RepID=UPI003FA5B8E7
MNGLRKSLGARGIREFDVLDFGACGDGKNLDTAAVQRAIDAAAAVGGRSRVIVPGGRRFLVGTLELRPGTELHLADDAELLASLRQQDYGADEALLVAHTALGACLSGTGRINGRSQEFMSHFDEADEWWRPAGFRPRLAVFSGCRDLVVRDVTFFRAPLWTLHLVGCEDVLVDSVRIRNQLDVPNCDGIDPDHCRNVVIRKCDIECGDDAIVIKTTREGMRYGPSSNIRVHDCVLATQDSGLKIGTETTQDIRDVRFERCRIKRGCRGLCIQLRDEGDVSGIEFRDIVFEARCFSDPWWGRGEAISFTAMPRERGGRVGRISDVRVIDVAGRAENSVRISGSRESRVSDVRFERVALEFDRWTRYAGGLWDNRPTSAYPEIEYHSTAAVHVRHADRVELRDCRVAWGAKPAEQFTHAVEAHDVTALSLPGFVGEAAHPDRLAAIAIEPERS